MADIVRITVHGELIMNDYFISRFTNTKNNDLRLHKKNKFSQFTGNKETDHASQKYPYDPLSVYVAPTLYTCSFFLFLERRWGVTLV